MLLVNLGQAGFMRLPLLPQRILHSIADVILQRMQVALQRRSLQHVALRSWPQRYTDACSVSVCIVQQIHALHCDELYMPETPLK